MSLRCTSQNQRSGDQRLTKMVISHSCSWGHTIKSNPASLLDTRRGGKVKHLICAGQRHRPTSSGPQQLIARKNVNKRLRSKVCFYSRNQHSTVPNTTLTHPSNAGPDTTHLHHLRSQPIIVSSHSAAAATTTTLIAQRHVRFAPPHPDHLREAHSSVCARNSSLAQPQHQLIHGSV